MADNKQPEFYIGDYCGGLYHQPTCSAVMHILGKIRFDSIPETEADGYVPHTCIPSAWTSLSPKVLVNRIPTSEELRELMDLWWRAVQSGESAQYRKLKGKRWGDLTAGDLKKIKTSDWIKFGLRAKGKKVID